MRKTVIATEPDAASSPSQTIRRQPTPLDVQTLARVEVTSEANAFPVENVFDVSSETGWRADTSGLQTVRILFDHPVTVRRMEVDFEESHASRTQEILLRWRDTGGVWRDILRQQWNFSPTGSTSEHEVIEAALNQATTFELQIKPEIGGGNAVASLRRWLLY